MTRRAMIAAALVAFAVLSTVGILVAMFGIDGRIELRGDETTKQTLALMATTTVSFIAGLVTGYVIGRNTPTLVSIVNDLVRNARRARA